MQVSSIQQAQSVSILRTYLRTLAILLLLIIICVNYKQLIQYYSAFSIANAMTHIETHHLTSTGLLLDIGYFFAVVFMLHAFWAAIITLSCLPWFRLCQNDNIRTQAWFIMVLLHCIFILAVNSYFYPTSLLGIFRGTPFASETFILLLGLVLFGCFLYGLSKLRLPGKGTLLAGTLILFMTLPLMLFIGETSSNDANANTISKPNVFIIGIDALRPDHLAHRGADPALAPNLNRLLSQALIYDRTYTPQGRTYVAWMGILSGQYPTTNGARFNLAPPEIVNSRLPLVANFAAHDYQTTYAMDERRFNQIDENYGFDKALGPKIGAADAIIANLADLPLVNLWVNTPVSRYLFPYLYINRAYGKAYDPAYFNQEVLDGLSTTKPNFLAVHFCQLHWPFTSKDFIKLDKSRWNGNYNHYMYQEMMKKVDVQIDEFMKGLKEKGLLDNAWVFLLSDHGEGFLLPQDKLSPAFQGGQLVDFTSDKLNVAAWGHGTNVLSQEQADVLLATLRYRDGKSVNPAGKVTGLFSLVDVAPSIFAELNFQLDPQDLPFDGQPLPQSVWDGDDARHVFVESSLPVNAINTSFIDDKKVMSETASSYEIRSNGRAVMKVDAYHSNIKLKQRSVYHRHWQLTMLPKDERLILVNTREKNWQTLSGYSGNAPWREMLTSLCSHYRDDITVSQRKECQPTAGNQEPNLETATDEKLLSMAVGQTLSAPTNDSQKEKPKAQ